MLEDAQQPVPVLTQVVPGAVHHPRHLKVGVQCDCVPSVPAQVHRVQRVAGLHARRVVGQHLDVRPDRRQGVTVELGGDLVSGLTET